MPQTAQSRLINFVTLNNAIVRPGGSASYRWLQQPQFTADFEASGLLTFEASDGETLEVMIADADMTETYTWTPPNSAEVVAFDAARSRASLTKTLRSHLSD